MTFVALTILSVIDTVLPCTNYDTSVIWIMCTDLSDLQCIPVRSLTGVILVTRLTSGARLMKCSDAYSAHRYVPNDIFIFFCIKSIGIDVL